MVDRAAVAGAQLGVPRHQLGARRADAGVQPLLLPAQQHERRHRRAGRVARVAELHRIVHAVVAAHVVVGRPERPLLRRGVGVGEGLEPRLVGRVLDVAQVGAIDVLDHVPRAVLDGHRVDRLALGQRHGQRDLDRQRPADLRRDAVPGEGGGLAVGSKFERGERLLLAVDRVVAPLAVGPAHALGEGHVHRIVAGQRHEQPEGEAEVRPVQDLPAGLHRGQAHERAGGAVEGEAKGVVLQRKSPPFLLPFWSVVWGVQPMVASRPMLSAMRTSSANRSAS